MYALRERDGGPSLAADGKPFVNATRFVERVDEPIRVMRVIARLNVGGPAIHVILLTERIGPPAFESTLVCGQVGAHEGDMSYLARERGVQPVVIDALGREISPLRDVATLWRLWRLMRAARPHVVHTHTAKAGVVGRLAARLAGVPVIVHTFHGHVFHGYFGAAKTRLFVALERLCARLSSRVLTISEGLKAELVAYGIAPAEKVTVVPLGLDLAPFAAMPRHAGRLRRELGVPDDAPLVGIVGRLVPVKNHRLFLEAAARVDAHAHFVIVGDGECRAEAERLAAASGLRGRVHFTGWRQDLPAIYSDLDALVISSNNEGTPVSIIEAMAAGVPAVSTAVGGVPDLIDDGRTGLLVPPGDVAALAGAINRALDDPALARQLADAARPEALARFGIERLVTDLTALYRALLTGRETV